MSMIEDVKEFHRFFGHPIGKRVRSLEPVRIQNRIKWKEEELTELKTAVANNDMTEVADALVDLVYFVLGTAIEMGIPFQKVWDAVHESNMAKAVRPSHTDHCPLLSEHEIPVKCTCGAVIYKEDGKTAKPADWKPPTNEITFLLLGDES